jgi:hypothetical protein
MQSTNCEAICYIIFSTLLVVGNLMSFGSKYNPSNCSFSYHRIHLYFCTPIPQPWHNNSYIHSLAWKCTLKSAMLCIASTPCCVFFHASSHQHLSWDTRYIKYYLLLCYNFIGFFTCYICRPVLGPTQPPIQWVLGALSLGVKRPGQKLTTHLCLVPGIRMSGAKPLFRHTCSCRDA